MEELVSLEKNTEKWSLGSDMKLLSSLREYSSTLSQRTSMLIDRVEELNSDVTIEHTRLRNMFNEFMIMSNTQFIENVSELVSFLQ
jgi:WASH complex subunit FAM21